MKLIVTGSRTWSAATKLNQTLGDWFVNATMEHEPFELVHGGASRGADALAHNWAIQALNVGLPVTEAVFMADWAKLGRGAGMIRNSEMVKYGTILQAFTDPCQKADCQDVMQHATHGAADTILKARMAGLVVREARSELWNR